MHKKFDFSARKTVDVDAALERLNCVERPRHGWIQNHSCPTNSLKRVQGEARDSASLQNFPYEHRASIHLAAPTEKTDQQRAGTH